MLLPNKLFSYQATGLPLLPEILTQLSEPMSPKDLATRLHPTTVDPLKIIDALDCLYALDRIDLNEEGMLHRCSKK